MADVFGRTEMAVGGAMSSDTTSVAFLNVDDAGVGFVDTGLLAQSIQYGYQQPISRIYEISSNLIYYVAGRPRGEGTMQSVLGPKPTTAAWFQRYGNVCLAWSNAFVFTGLAGCQGGIGDLMYVLIGVILLSVSDSVQAEQMMISENIQYMFASLSKT